jgi:hypothetical protein
MTDQQHEYTTSEAFLMAFGGTFFATLIYLMVLIIDAFAVMLSWNWIVPYIFTSLPHLNLAEAAGIAVVVGYMTHQWTYVPSEQSKRFIIATALIKPVTAVVSAFIIHFFI